MIFRARKSLLYNRSFNVVDENKNIRRKELLKIAILTSLLLCASHLLLGSDPVVVLLSVLIIIFGTIPIVLIGYLNTVSLFIFLIAFRYVDFATVAKLIMIQPLDSNLYQPVEAFFAVLLGLTGYFFAFLVSSSISVGKPLLKQALGERQLLLISIISILIGSLAWLGEINAVNKMANGIDISQNIKIYAFFTSFSLLAIISATAQVLIASNGKRSISNWCVILIFMEFVFGFIANSRMTILNGILSYVLTIISFRGRMQWRYIAVICISVFCILSFITPIMLYVRGIGSELPAIDRLKSTIYTASTAIQNVRMFNELKERMNQSQSFLKYYGEPKNILERGSLVEHVDAVINGTNLSRNTGFESIKIGFRKILPRFLDPQKTVGYSIGDWLYDKISVTSSYGGFATVPLIAEGYSSFGWLGVFIFPILFSIPIFLAFKKLGWSLTQNIWMIYLVIRFHNSFVEGDTSTYMLTLFRILPQDILLILTINFIAKILAIRPFRKKIIIPS